jgi:hypothetical protein
MLTVPKLLKSQMYQTYVRATGVEAAPMKDETVLFNPGNRKFCVLNVTAAMIWDILDRPRTLAEIVGSVCERYQGADPGQVEQDVQKALEELRGIACVADG